MAKYEITWSTTFTGIYDFEDDLDAESWAYDCPPEEELSRGDWTTTVVRLDG